MKHIGKLGAFGESLGGLVACHIAAKLHLDLLVADRTFGSLEAVAEHGFHPVAGWLLRNVRWWGDVTAYNFVEAECYKVVTCDPNDEMICENSSLKAQVC